MPEVNCKGSYGLGTACQKCEKCEKEMDRFQQKEMTRNSIIDEAVDVIKTCELVAPNVYRIRLHEALGALICMKR